MSEGQQRSRLLQWSEDLKSPFFGALENLERSRSALCIQWGRAQELFKYTDRFAAEILRTRRMKLCVALEANDPFEFSPRRNDFAARAQEEAFLKMWASSPDEVLESCWRRVVTRRSEQEYKAEMRAEFDRWLQEHQKTGCSLIEVARLRFVEASSAQTAVLCLSSRPADLLMWSHYANCYRGAVVGVDAMRILHLDGVWGIRKVRYTSRRPQISPRRRSPWAIFRDMISLLTTKSKCWSYECEWRAPVNRSFAEEQTIETGTTLVFLPFPDTKIFTRVIVGFKSDPSAVHELLSILRQDEYQHIKIQIAEPDPIRYRVLLVDSNLDALASRFAASSC